MSGIYEGLTDEDRNGKIVPGVASSWTVDATGTIYTFQLRRDARWSDGKPVTAEEFAEGLDELWIRKLRLDGRTTERIRGAIVTAGRRRAGELRVAAPDYSTVKIELEHPAPFILQILSQPIAAPVYIPTTSIDEANQKETHKPTNGPYRLVDRVPNSFIELKRNPYYWDSKNVAISEVRYVNVESESTELREYIAGQLDLTFTIPTSDVERMTRDYGSEVQIAPILGTFYLALDVSEPPLRATWNCVRRFRLRLTGRKLQSSY